MVLVTLFVPCRSGGGSGGGGSSGSSSSSGGGGGNHENKTNKPMQLWNYSQRAQQYMDRKVITPAA